MSNIPNAVSALQFDVSYDTSVLDFTDNFTKGDLVSSFTYFDVRGKYKLAAADVSLPKGSLVFKR